MQEPQLPPDTAPPTSAPTASPDFFGPERPYAEPSPLAPPIPLPVGAVARKRPPDGPDVAEIGAEITLRTVARDVARTLLHPRPILPLAPHAWKWKVWSRVVGLYVLGMIVAAMVTAAAVKATGASNLLDQMRQDATTPRGQIMLLLLAGVVAPLWEETAFRLPLARFHAARLLPSLALIAALLGTSLPAAVRPLVFVVLGAIAVVAAVSLVSKPWHSAVEAWWGSHFGWVVAFSVVAFGLAHGGNYRFPGASALTLLAIPFLVTPQLIAGALLAYVRQRLGFWYGVALHSSVNTLLVSLSLLVPADKAAKPAAPPANLPGQSRPAQPPRPARPAEPIRGATSI